MLRYLLLSLAAVASVVSSEVISYTSDTFGNAVERHLKVIIRYLATSLRASSNGSVRIAGRKDRHGRLLCPLVSFSSNPPMPKVTVPIVLCRCGHSKKFLPIYDEISEEFEAYNGNRVGEGGNEKRLDDFVFAKVDCVKEMALYSSEGIEHFPTIKVYLSGGEKILYNVSLSPSLASHTSA